MLEKFLNAGHYTIMSGRQMGKTACEHAILKEYVKYLTRSAKKMWKNNKNPKYKGMVFMGIYDYTTKKSQRAFILSNGTKKLDVQYGSWQQAKLDGWVKVK